MGSKCIPEWPELTEQLWIEFFNRLQGEEGCNFRQDDRGKTIWNCGGGNNLDFSKEILTKMGFDYSVVDVILERFCEYGGHCDCEVLFNVKQWILPDKEDEE